MEWLSGIIKELKISKVLVAAIFSTSVVMHFGPAVTPTNIPRLPSELAGYIFATMLLTGFLLLFWGASWIFRLSTQGARSAVKALRVKELTDQEKALLFFMARDPSEPINLNQVNYDRAPGTKLEFHHWTKTLEKKGLATINPWDDNLISLTDAGRERALEIQRAVKAS
jgi:hypothetical protein